MKKSSKIVENQAAAAALLCVPLAEIRRARRAGCDAFTQGNRIDPAKLRAWLKAHPKPRATHTAPENLPVGAQHALTRLEQAEADAFAAMKSESDPDERERRRREWLATLDALRKQDLAVEQSRRESGAMVLRSEVEQDVANLMYAVWRAIEDAFYQDLAPRLVGMTDAVSVGVILHAQLEKARGVLRVQLSPLAGTAKASEAFKCIVEEQDARVALHACNIEAFSTGKARLWADFQDWRRGKENELVEKRKAAML